MAASEASSLSGIFSKLQSYQQGSGSANESTPLTGEGQQGGVSGALAEGGMQMVNETVLKIQKMNESAPYSFRVLGLVGGLVVVVINALSIIGRALTLNITGAIISFYLIVFGFIIILLEADTLVEGGVGRTLEETVRLYFKFLEFSWGRGALYFFVGTLQFNINLIDGLVGGFMMFVGATAIAAGIKSAQDLKQLRAAIRNESDLKARWNRYDKDGSGHLSIEELSDFLKDAGITMTNHEVVSAYMALNKNFDDKLSYDELLEWWANPMTGATGLPQLSV